MFIKFSQFPNFALLHSLKINILGLKQRSIFKEIVVWFRFHDAVTGDEECENYHTSKTSALTVFSLAYDEYFQKGP